jgi:integrase
VAFTTVPLNSFPPQLSTTDESADAKGRSALTVARIVHAAAGDSHGHTQKPPRAPFLELNAPALPLGSMRFPEAAKAWLLTRQYHIAPRTYLDYGRYIEILSRCFRRVTLSEITGDMLRDYQRRRRQTVAPGTINKECGMICMMRDRIGRPLTDYQRMQMPKDYESPGRALTADEEAKLERVFKAAAYHPQWKTAALLSLLSMKCGAGPGEMLSLSLKDVGLDPPHITIPRRGAKHISRERHLALNETAAWALARLIERAQTECKCTLPEHYLIPRRNRDHSYDPTKPAQGWRGGLDHLLALAEVKVRRYDFRHHAVSVALSNPNVSLEAARAYFGWTSPKMVERYSHQNQASMRVVAAALDRKSQAPAKPKSKQKATVVEIVPRRVVALVRENRLCLPASSEEGR